MGSSVKFKKDGSIMSSLGNELNYRYLLVIILLLFSNTSCNIETKDEPIVIEETVIDSVWSGHPVGFSLLTHKNKQFVGYYDQNRIMTLASRNIGDKKWAKKHLFAEKLGWDSHNSIEMAMDREGYLHVSGNMHNDSLVYYRSRKPYNVQSLQKINKMTGKLEQSVTYPMFIKNREKGELLFIYRSGGSGKGKRLVNVYNLETKSWQRLLEQPLFNGSNYDMNSYPAPPKVGPKGWYHIVWMWRNTPDCETNHDISYIKSRDFKNWQTVGGKSVSLPITPDNKDVIVDPVEPEGGLINMEHKVSFDKKGRPVIIYHKYDKQGDSQIYLTRWKNSKWNVNRLSNWDKRWNFEGRGSIPCKVWGSALKIRDGKLSMNWYNQYIGKGRWILDSNTLEIVDRLDLKSKVPESLNEPQTNLEGVQVHWKQNTGDSVSKNGRYYLRWETLPANRDRARSKSIPAPSRLKLYYFKY